jgi:hypothetical protein
MLEELYRRGANQVKNHRLLGTLESYLLCLPVHCKGGVTARCIRRTCFPCGPRRYAHYSILWTSHGYDSRTIIKERGSPPNYPCPGTFSLGSLCYFCFVFPPLFLRSLFSAISLGRVPPSGSFPLLLGYVSSCLTVKDAMQRH